jgi:hypothetical protein
MHPLIIHGALPSGFLFLAKSLPQGFLFLAKSLPQGFLFLAKPIKGLFRRQTIFLVYHDVNYSRSTTSRITIFIKTNKGIA